MNSEEYKKNLNLFACLFQAAMWQTSTFAYDFHFNTKYSIKKFANLAYDMIDKICNDIKDNKEASEYFDEQTSFYLDVAREISDITDNDKRELLLEVIKSIKDNKLKVTREK